MLGKVIETLKEPPQTIYFQQMQDVEFLSELKLFGRNQNETSGLRRFLCADSEAAYLVGIANFDRSISKPTLEARI